MRKRILSVFLMITMICMFVPTIMIHAADISVSVERIQNGYTEYGIVRAFERGETIWEFTTPITPRTELQGISEVYRNNGTVYVAACNTLYALDINSGSIKWQVSDVGASNCIVFDDSGNVYVSGYYGPNVIVIDSNGNTLYKDNSSDYYWVYDLKIIGNTLNIYYESDLGGIKTLDISQFESNEITVQVNGNEILFDQPPIILNDRTLVPVRAIFEALGATVDWGNNTVTARRNGTIISIGIGDNYMRKNSERIALDAPARIVNDRTLVPVRAIAEAFDCDVTWDGGSRSVIIQDN